MDATALVPLSLSDHEGCVAAVVFVPGCNFRCPYCHNADLVQPERAARRHRLPIQTVLDDLRERRGFLDSVVVSGGEPTLQPDLADFFERVHGLGLLTKLDTNGSRPDVLACLLEQELVDYVAVDVKAPERRYAQFAGVEVDTATIRESLRLVRSLAPAYEFRTTAAPGLEESDLQAIARWISGAERFFLQPFYVPAEKELIDPAWAARDALSPEALREMWPRLAQFVHTGGVRG